MVERKVLVLYAYDQNDPSFTARFSGLQSSLVDVGYTLSFGKIALVRDTMEAFCEPLSRSSTCESESRCLWVSDPEETDHEYVLDYIEAHCDTHGPVEGIVGVSHNDALREVLTSDRISNFFPSLQWMVCLSYDFVTENIDLRHIIANPSMLVFDRVGSDEEEFDMSYYEEFEADTFGDTSFISEYPKRSEYSEKI